MWIHNLTVCLNTRTAWRRLYICFCVCLKNVSENLKVTFCVNWCSCHWWHLLDVTCTNTYPYNLYIKIQVGKKPSATSVFVNWQHFIPHSPFFKIETGLVKCLQMSSHAGNLHMLSYSNLVCHGMWLQAKKQHVNSTLLNIIKDLFFSLQPLFWSMYFIIFGANLPFVILEMIYIYKSAVKTPQSHRLNPASFKAD